VVVEARVGTRRPDIVLLAAGHVVAAIEIYVRNAVDQWKAQEFAEGGSAWIEVSAHEVLRPSSRSRRKAWRAHEPLSIRAVGPALDWRCDTCSQPAKPAPPSATERERLFLSRCAKDDSDDGELPRLAAELTGLLSEFEQDKDAATSDLLEAAYFDLLEDNCNGYFPIAYQIGDLFVIGGVPRREIFVLTRSAYCSGWGAYFLHTSADRRFHVALDGFATLREATTAACAREGIRGIERALIPWRHFTSGEIPRNRAELERWHQTYQLPAWFALQVPASLGWQTRRLKFLDLARIVCGSLLRAELGRRQKAA
jgi:hypothetical protein